MTRFATLLAFLALLIAPTAAQTAFFNDTTDVILVDGQTVLGPTSTYEVVILFPSSGSANGRVFNEWTVFQEDKLLTAGPTLVQGYNFPIGGVVSGFPSMGPDVWHHVAFVSDGGEKRIYVDGTLVAAEAAGGDIGDGGGLAHIGAIFRDNVLRNSFVGYLESLRISDVARYTGTSFDHPTGDLPSDDNTLLLYHFDEPAGSPTVQDESPLDRTGTLGTGFDGATAPELGGAPPLVDCPINNGVSWDLWDVSRGNMISGSSGFRSGDDEEGENIFGGAFSTPEPGVAFFQDGQPDGFTHFVEWETSAAVTPRSIFLRASHDQGIIRRAFRTFRLFGYNDTTASFELLHAFDPPLPYGGGQSGNEITACINVPERTTNRFRAEFVQEGAGTFFGPRVIELEAYTTPVADLSPTPNEEGAHPYESVLHAVYPNPFMGHAVLVYDLPKPESVRLAVYDLLGREVAVLADGVRSAGRHEALLDGSGLPSGVYLVRLTADGFQHTRTVTLLR